MNEDVRYVGELPGATIARRWRFRE